jgi:LPXTG-motif cell wall-anchored protein
MKNNFYVKGLFFLAFLAVVLVAKADDLPMLTPANFPFQFSVNADHNDRLIDIDENGTCDYRISFNHNPIGTFCAISSSFCDSRNTVLSEIGSLTAPVASNPPLSNSTIYYTTLLNSGDLISAGSGLWWGNGSHIFYKLDSHAPLGSNFTTPKYSGYIGLHYYTSPSDLVGNYGWLSVDIDPALQYVTIGSAGHSESPGSGILAGTGSSAVPIPLIASILGFGLVGGGIFFKRRKKK